MFVLWNNYAKNIERVKKLIIPWVKWLRDGFLTGDLLSGFNFNEKTKVIQLTQDVNLRQ